MLGKRREAAERVAAKLFAAEKALDAAMAEIADLAGELPRARMHAGVAACIGQGAFEHVASAMGGIAQVRRSIVATHEELAGAKTSAGLSRVTLDGGGDKQPPPEPGYLYAVGE